MNLNKEGLANTKEWVEKGYKVPEYDRDKMVRKTMENPVWVHFGAGNIFRAFLANIAQNLLNSGKLDRGITVVEGYDYEIIEKQYRPTDNYSILVTLKADGNVEKTVIGSIAESCILDSENEKEFGRLKEIFKSESLQLATFTITEKGYSINDSAGNIPPVIERDMKNGPLKPESYIGKVAALLYTRYESGKKPIAMVSADNCSHNGDKLYGAMISLATKWAENGLVDAGFVDYVNDKEKVSFPCTMIDKITPRPDPSVEAILKEDGIEGISPTVTSKNTYVAPFVNAEETEYLVVEDVFPNSRPALEEGGVIFTDRETVDKVERMKVCTCLNPLHTALAVYGCLLGYTKIADEMNDTCLKKLVEGIGYVEGLPVVVDPKVIAPKEFIDTVLNVRIPNPFMPDTPQRIATDTSQKLSIRYGETIKNYIKQGRDLKDLKLIPLVLAGWIRYMMGIDDKGEKFDISPDPMTDYVKTFVKDIKLGESEGLMDKIKPLLRDEKIFGINLEEIKMDILVCDYLSELIAGPGAVRSTLNKYVNQ